MSTSLMSHTTYKLINMLDPQVYFQDAYYIEEPRSKSMSRKYKSEDNKANMQDTKGEDVLPLIKDGSSDGSWNEGIAQYIAL